MIGRLKRMPYARSFAVALLLVVLYIVAGVFGAPVLIGRAITNYAAEQLERKASVGEVRVNPLLFTLELKDFVLAERDGAQIAGFKRLLLDFELSSLARRAWTFSEITLEGLDLRADIAPDGRFNLAALVDKLPKRERKPDEKPPRLLLQRVVLSDGRIAFSDRSDRTPASAALSPINLELKDISTLPDQRGAYSVTARLVDGGSFSWRGEMSLEPLASQGEVSVKGVKPRTAWRFFQDELALIEPKGEFDYSARYRVAYSGGTLQATAANIELAGRGIALTAAGATEPMLTLATIAVSGGRFDLVAREIVFPSVEVRDGVVVTEVDPGGAINWLKVFRPSAGGGTQKPATGGAVTGSKAVEPAAGPPSRPWTAKVESLRVTGIGLRHTDRSRAKPIRIVAEDVAVSLAATLATQPGGAQTLLDAVTLTLKQPAISEPDAKEPLVAFDAITLDGGKVNFDEREAAIGRIAVAGGSVRVVREKNGTVPILDFLAGKGLVRRELAGALDQAKAAGRPWRVGVDALELNGARIAFSDLSFGEPITCNVRDLRLRVNGIRSDGKEPAKFDGALRIEQGGALSASGVIGMNGEQAGVRAKLDRINLKPLQPAIASHARAVLASGELSAEIRADYRVRGGKTQLRASGPVRIDNLLVNEADSGERLLGWQTLAASGVSLSLAPDELKIEELRLAKLTTKVVVYKDRTLNLAKVVIQEPAQTGGGTAQAARSTDTEAPFPASIERVKFENGDVDFADLSLVLPFAARVQELEGWVQGLSTNRASRASAKLEGRVDEYGLARAEGTLSPFHPKTFLDLTVSFRNVEMPPLSPYSATFAGRRIASGRLALDVRYKIDNGALAGDNRIVLEKFTLGERVEAPGALNLPLDLAIALLTDSDGKIDVAVPVKGNVDDPEFSYGHLVWQAIRTLITRIVTAPFRALAALFGGGDSEKLDSIVFDPGRATLLPPEREKLKRVADGLGKRPQLRLVAEGQHGADDRVALQRRDVEIAVAAKLGRPPAAGAVSEPVNLTEAKTQRALEAVFVERQSEEALSKFAAETEKARGKEVQRVNAALALIGRGSADQEFYQALLKRLNETARVPEAALAELASERARAVMEHLTTALSVPAARTEARTATAAGGAEVKLTFDVARVAASAASSGNEGQPEPARDR